MKINVNTDSGGGRVDVKGGRDGDRDYSETRTTRRSSEVSYKDLPDAIDRDGRSVALGQSADFDHLDAPCSVIGDGRSTS